MIEELLKLSNGVIFSVLKVKFRLVIAVATMPCQTNFQSNTELKPTGLSLIKLNINGLVFQYLAKQLES